MTVLSAPSPDRPLDTAKADEALACLLRVLKLQGYQFVTPTPATHARVLARTNGRSARDLRDILGWSMPFDPEILDDDVLEPLVAARALEAVGDGLFRCTYRVSMLGGDLFLHSAYPTDAEDAVFLGPDSYRFASFIDSELDRRPTIPGEHLVDLGAGSGVGGVIAAKLCPGLRVSMTDINPSALRLARINAAAAGIRASAHVGEGLDPVEGALDVVLANPPYIIDDAGRDYRDGGDMHGAGVAFRMASAALPRLSPGGRLILYTGSPIINGSDPLRHSLMHLAEGAGCEFRYREIDPDVFGEELERPEYRTVERIAVVASVITRRT